MSTEASLTKYLVTGVAGFIGFHTAQRLLARGAGSVLSALAVAHSRGAQQGVAWLCSSLDLRLRSEARCGAGVSRCEGLGTTRWGQPGRDDGTWDVKAHRGARARRGAHVADETPCDAVG